jgi:RNA polymerase sigma factor (sigma-70 family)
METLTLSPETQTLQKLAEACARQDRASQKALYDQFKNQLFRVCLRYAANSQEAEDFLQEGFLKVFKSIHTWQPSGNLVAWMKTIMIHTALEHQRKLSAKVGRVDITQAENLQGTEEILSQISGEELMEIIQGLPDGFRTVFNLYAVEGYSHSEIASLLTISEGTSKSQYSRAKSILRDKCSQLLEGSRS